MMISHIDLHTHSNYSDGELSPQQLVELANQCGVKALALTDHDNTEGIEAALSAAHSHDMTLIPGIEMSVAWMNREVHIVGLNIDHRSEQLQKKLKIQGERRHQRAMEIASKLEKLGMANVYQGVKELTTHSFIGRLHFAKYLIKEGYCKDHHAAFNRYLGTDRSAYVPSRWMEMEDAIQTIKSVGGRSAIAHPLRYRLKPQELRQLIKQFRSMGGDGIEVITAYQTPQTINRVVNYIQSHDLLASCGSDFHGPKTNHIKLGQLADFPEKCQPIWYDWDLERGV